MASFIQEFPGNSYDNVLRIHISAHKILRQNLSANDPNHFEIEIAPTYHWSFLAPPQLQEAIAHNYEEYSSFQGRAAQAVSDLTTSYEKIIQAAQGFSRGKGNTDPARNKVDSPIVYVGSNRKEYNFTFDLAWWKGSTYSDVFSPIHNFRVLSSAELGDTIDTITPPAVFSIYSDPGNMVSIEFCALTNIQATYSYPFVDGYPSKAELTLTFKDFKPLYADLWKNEKNRITTAGTLI